MFARSFDIGEKITGMADSCAILEMICRLRERERRVEVGGQALFYIGPGIGDQQQCGAICSVGLSDQALTQSMSWSRRRSTEIVVVVLVSNARADRAGLREGCSRR